MFCGVRETGREHAGGEGEQGAACVAESEDIVGMSLLHPAGLLLRHGLPLSPSTTQGARSLLSRLLAGRPRQPRGSWCPLQLRQGGRAVAGRHLKACAGQRLARRGCSPGVKSVCPAARGCGHRVGGHPGLACSARTPRSVGLLSTSQGSCALSSGSYFTQVRTMS